MLDEASHDEGWFINVQKLMGCSDVQVRAEMFLKNHQSQFINWPMVVY